jgi:gluconokinase
MVVVIMGPAGAGKSTVGARLAKTLGWDFHDADDLHRPDNVARMRAGLPLRDAERGPWLAAVARLIADHVRGGTPVVLACSALKRAYRRALMPADAAPGDVRFVYLRASPGLLAARLAERRRHFFPADLLVSQLADLEEPGDDEAVPVLSVDADAPIGRLVREIRRALAV